MMVESIAVSSADQQHAAMTSEMRFDEYVPCAITIGPIRTGEAILGAAKRDEDNEIDNVSSVSYPFI